MRTLILVILAGAALYFAWPHFGGVDASAPPEGQSSAEESGELLVPEAFGSLQSLAELEARVRNEPAEAAEVEEPESPKSTANSGSIDKSASDDGFDELDLNALGDPLYEGSLLLHQPDELQAYLKGRGRDLSSSRKKLLIAYLLLARGQYGQVPKYAEGLEKASEVTAEELALLQAAQDGRVVGTRDASHRPHKNPLVLGASMSFLERDATEAATAGKWADAAAMLSELLVAEIDAPWEADDPTLQRWATALEDAQASHRWSPEGKWRSMDVVVEPGDTLVGIRKKVLETKPSLQICTGLIERSNQLGRYLRQNQVLRIPLDPVHTLIDLSARWLYYMHGSEVVGAWPIAIGRVGQETTPGRYTVGNKTPEPPWFPEGRRMVPYGDPENPLGTRWIGLDGSDGLGIHGTWEPESIGSMASDGCVRLRNEKVELLFEIIPQGSEVVIRP